MKKLFVKFQNTLRDRSGQAMVEYGLIIALVAIVVIIALAAFGTKIQGVFTDIVGRF